MESRDCKAKPACHPGMQGRSGKCQFCCVSDYCNDMVPEDYDSLDDSTCPGYILDEEIIPCGEYWENLYL